MPAKPYNGHRSWNAWNVALWIGNDEGLYREALRCTRVALTRDHAARMFLRVIGDNARTPDGARYNLTCVREALAGLE